MFQGYFIPALSALHDSRRQPHRKRTETKRMLTNIDLDRDSTRKTYAFEDAYEDYEDDDFDEGSEEDFDDFEDEDDFEEDGDVDDDFDDFGEEGTFDEDEDDFDYEDDDLEYDDFDE
ncbi:MAG: hypothetical protein JW875_02755 [Spirochaetales bacterium]|nr:hypothetical protein [Spirochaetales bacterium]